MVYGTMVKKCILCKKEWNRLESCSFHKFPANDEAKKKWMNALRLTSIPKDAVLCSDHFDISSFDNMGGLYGCAIRRRLLPNAVPKIKISQDSGVLSNLSNNSNMSTFSDHNTKVFNDIAANQSTTNFNDNSDVTIKTNKCIEVSKKVMQKDVLDHDIKISTNVGNTSGTSKRKISSADGHSTKRIRFTTRFRTEYISRKDFISDESWERFLRFNKYKNSQLRNAHNKSSRNQKITGNMKSLIKNLKEKQLCISCS